MNSENISKDSVMVLSGGMDSVTLLHHSASRIALAITFDYGSNHNAREIECARKQCEILHIPHIVIPIDLAGFLRSSLFEGSEAIPEGNYDEENMKSTVVPFRNGIMLSIACGVAESNGLRHVMIANHGGDHTIYPDCRPGFIDAMSDAMKEGSFERIDIVAPFTNISKSDIAAIGGKLGVDYSLTYSCYKGNERHCGKCGTCRERKEAFMLAGVPDPTVYEE